MLHRIKSDLAILEKLNAGKDKPDVFVPQYNSQKILLSTQGLMLSEAYKERWENNKKTYKPVKFENVDSVPGLSAELVDKFLKENYPEKYITGSTDSIEFDDERMIAESGDVEVLGFTESASVGFDKPVRENGPNNIVIFDAGGEINKKTFFEILKHEVHHTNDWKTSRLLTSADRISMLYDMAKRIKESDKYTSEYLGMIDKGVIESHVDKKILKKLDLEKTINLIRATEYWPEIAKAYFENKEQFKKDHPKDYELVKKWADKMTESKGN